MTPRPARGTSSVAKKKAPPAKGLPPPTPSEAAFEAAFRDFDAPGVPRETASDAARDAIDRLFEKSDEYLHDFYSTIGGRH